VVKKAKIKLKSKIRLIETNRKQDRIRPKIRHKMAKIKPLKTPHYKSVKEQIFLLAISLRELPKQICAVLESSVMT